MFTKILSLQTVASSNSICNNVSSNTCVAKIDSGATHNYIKYDHNHVLQHTKKLFNGPVAYLPDKTTIKADRQGILPLHPSLSTTAQKAFSFPDLKNESLISVGQLCDDNCKVIFDKTSVKVTKNNVTILKGRRSPTDKLYDIDLNCTNPSKGSNVSHKINYIIRQNKTKTDLARYLHASAFSPSISTFEKAVKNGNFVTWPGIENLNFNKLVGNTIATAKGHLDNERKNLQSTKPLLEALNDNFPEKINQKLQEQFVAITNVQKHVSNSEKPIWISREDSLICPVEAINMS